MSGGSVAGRISVRTRIYAGFSVVLVLLVAVGAIGVGSIRHALGTFESYSNSADDSAPSTPLKSSCRRPRTMP